MNKDMKRAVLLFSLFNLGHFTFSGLNLEGPITEFASGATVGLAFLYIVKGVLPLAMRQKIKSIKMGGLQ